LTDKLIIATGIPCHRERARCIAFRINMKLSAKTTADSVEA